MAYLILFSVKCLTRLDDKWGGEFTQSSTTLMLVWEKMSGCGWNISDRWTLKSSALSESEMI